MSAVDVEVLEALVAKWTPRVRLGGHTSACLCVACEDRARAEAATINALPSLLTEVRQLRAENAALREERDTERHQTQVVWAAAFEASEAWRRFDGDGTADIEGRIWQLRGALEATRLPADLTGVRSRLDIERAATAAAESLAEQSKEPRT
jgi:hypothetical protein